MLIVGFVSFVVGNIMGVVLMSLLITGKRADRGMEQNEQHIHSLTEGQVKQCENEIM